MVDKSDPSYGVFVEVAKWNNTIECMPEWEELLEYEYIRQRGLINMFDNVGQHAYDTGLLNACVWVMRCQEARISVNQLFSIAVEFYEKEHGPRDTWITDEIRTSYDELELDAEELQLMQKMRVLKARKRALKK